MLDLESIANAALKRASKEPNSGQKRKKPSQEVSNVQSHSGKADKFTPKYSPSNPTPGQPAIVPDFSSFFPDNTFSAGGLGGVGMTANLGQDTAGMAYHHGMDEERPNGNERPSLPNDLSDPSLSFEQPFIPQDLWQMPMTFEWDWTGFGSNTNPS